MSAALKPLATYRGWLVRYDPPPIPVRDFDWTATHPDYDGEGDNRHVFGKDLHDLKRAVRVWEQENEDEEA